MQIGLIGETKLEAINEETHIMDSLKQLLIPDKIKVGFCSRDDTYTKKLAYVIYYDKKGVLRKEKSWESWRDKEIDPIDFENIPIEGFVLNKKVGGYKSHWNFRDAHVRVYDPRGFEFEISVPNLIYILTQCDCSRGKGLEGKFVYSWEGTELVLLPADSEDYKNSKKFTNLQTCKVKAKELIPGASYQTKRQELLIYLGKFVKYCVSNGYNREETGPKRVFWNGKEFVFLKDLNSIASLHSDIIAPDYAELVDKYNKSIWGSKPVALFTNIAKKADIEKIYDYWAYEESPGVYLQCQSNYQNGYYKFTNECGPMEETIHTITHARLYIRDNVLVSEQYYRYAYKDKEMINRKINMYRNYKSYYINTYLDKYIEPTGLELWVELESGSKFKVSTDCLIEPKTKENDYGEQDEY